MGSVDTLFNIAYHWKWSPTEIDLMKYSDLEIYISQTIRIIEDEEE